MSTPILKDHVSTVSTDQDLNDQRLKDQILAVIDHLSGDALTQVLTYVQSLTPEAAASPSTSTPDTANSATSATASTDEASVAELEVVFADQNAVWRAYLETETEREEVYHRLADS